MSMPIVFSFVFAFPIVPVAPAVLVLGPFFVAFSVSVASLALIRPVGRPFAPVMVMAMFVLPVLFLRSLQRPFFFALSLGLLGGQLLLEFVKAVHLEY